MIQFSHWLLSSLVSFTVATSCLYGGLAFAEIGDCSPIAGLESVSKDGIVVIGEYHGTREPAELFADMVCARLANGGDGNVLVAIEMPQDLNDILQSAEPDQFRRLRKQLREHRYWSSMRDGRSSATGLQLAEWLLRQRSIHPERLHLLAFQIKDLDVAGAKLIDARMREHAVESGYVFTGNAHARKVPIADQQKHVLAGELVKLGHEVTSLNIRFGTGQAWFCNPDCAAVSLPSGSMQGERRIELDSCKSDWAYDGWYFIPELTVSEAVHPDVLP